MPLRILITGATGFVGSHILEMFKNNPSVTLIAACRDQSKLSNSFRGEIRQGNLLESNYVESVVKNVDVICHAAAWSSLFGHKKESEKRFLEPTLTLINAAKKAGVKRFINTSTTSAAAPENSKDPMSKGVERKFWPHLCNIIKIENYLREQSSAQFKVVNLRLGIFAGERYSLGLLPILLPRLKTHLVPWIKRGQTHLPIIDGRDIGQAFAKAAVAEDLAIYEGFNIIGQEAPTIRTLLNYINTEFNYPKPHFSVPFFIAYPFAWLMEVINPIVFWEPLVTRSIVHLCEETQADNHKAAKLLAYQPKFHWTESVHNQIVEIQQRQTKPMPMSIPID